MKNLILFLLIITSSVLFSQTIVDEDFESTILGTLPDGWNIRLNLNGSGMENQKVVDSPVKNGVHSFQLEGTSGTFASVAKTISNLPNKLTIETWMYADDNLNGNDGSISIGTNSESTGVSFYQSNIVVSYYPGGSIQILQPFTIKTWYHIKMEADLANRTYQVFINNALATSSNVSTFQMHAGSDTQIMLNASNEGTMKMFFDDIKVYKTNPNLVAYYPFNGDADDESGNLLHGSINGATITNDRFGNLESAYSFDGNDIITIPYDEKLNADSQLSISVWVKPNIQQDALILGKSNWWAQTNYLLRTKSTGFLQFEYRDMSYNNNIPLIVNEWNHIAVVSDVNNIKKIYINNVLATHTGGSSPFNMVQEVLTIGGSGSNGYNAEYFKGTIDDLRIYKTTLSESEISNLYNYNTLKVDKIEKSTTSNFYVFENTLYFKTTQNLSEIKSVEVYNLLGQNVFKTSGIEKELQLNNLQNGVYILKVEKTSGDYSTLKFIIN